MRISALAAGLLVLLPGPLAAQTLQGDTERGEALFSQCKGCHQVGPEAESRIGPHLNGIFGRQAGAISEFRYSKSMQRAGADGLTWDHDTLGAYLANPRSLVSGTRMSFRGLKDPQDLADVMAFLRSYSDNPRDIPESAPTLRADDPDLTPEVLAMQGDAEFGEYLSAECTTCHQADGSAEGIPSITNWPSEDFVMAMHAYKQSLRPHPVMQMIAGRLSDEEIAALAAYFEDLAP